MMEVHINYISDINRIAAEFRGVVLFDMYADWCGPCRKLAPDLTTLAEKCSPHLLVCKVNVDDLCLEEFVLGQNQPIPIRSLPTVVIVKNSTIVDIITGCNIDQIRTSVVKNLY